eukprot:4054633-Pleurochrysis_carterae.AAC.2
MFYEGNHACTTNGSTAKARCGKHRNSGILARGFKAMSTDHAEVTHNHIRYSFHTTVPKSIQKS